MGNGGDGGRGHCTGPLLPNGTGHKTARAYDNWGNFRSGAEEFRLVHCLKMMSKRKECDGCLNGIPSRALLEKDAKT